MDGVFSGVSTDSIEKFLARMLVYDVSMPHTNHRLSPITFSEFLVRNNILCINQYQVYDAANKFWQRYLALTPNTLEMCQKPFDMNICEEEHAGWNKLIDFFNRVLDVQKFEKHPYYQMHYLAHVCYLFYQTKFKDDNETLCYRTIFNEVMTPILYEPFVKTNTPIWMPIMNYSDIRFMESLVVLCARVSGFIDSHSGRMMDNKQFDISRLKSLHGIINECLHGVHDNKYNDDNWKPALVNCLSKTSILKADMELCELHDSFARDGMKCCPVFDELNRIRHRYEKNLFDDDPDEVIDELLDAYCVLSKGLQSYDISMKKEETKS